jgi:hypothetical protein
MIGLSGIKGNQVVEQPTVSVCILLDIVRTHGRDGSLEIAGFLVNLSPTPCWQP